MSPAFPTSLRTARLTLRPFSVEDAARVLVIQSNWAVMRMLRAATWPATLGSTRDWLASHEGEWRSGTGYRFAIVLEGAVMGCADVDEIAGGRGVLGYWVDEAAWGRGVATEAAGEVVDFALARLGLDGLDSGHASDNPGSCRVLGKLGFRRVGEKRLWSNPRGEEITQWTYALDRAGVERLQGTDVGATRRLDPPHPTLSPAKGGGEGFAPPPFAAALTERGARAPFRAFRKISLPSRFMHAYRSHTCGALRLADRGESVRLSGWIHRKRDHGGLLFVDLRDHYGLTQLVVHPGAPGFEALDRLRAESVVTVDGEVVARTPDTINPNLPTGEIEVKVSRVAILSEAAELPLPVFGEPDYPEDIRLTHRYLDLRRETLHRNIVLRSQVIDSIRRRMVDQGFTEFQTPILTASSPEGARDFLVPSRLHPGQFYALPQAPQQFKQLLMVAGFDRYFQIAPCFRDEDARADRSLEFYQLDVEMSFVTQEDVFEAIEPVLHGVFAEFSQGKTVTPYPFPRIAYRDAIARYGSDKPDLRNPLIMADVSAHFRDGGFGLFARMLESARNAIWAIPAPGGGSRAFCDRMNAWAQGEGQPGLGYIFWRAGEGEEGGAAGPVARNLGPERSEAIRAQLGLEVGDAAFFVGGDPKTFYKFAGLARTRVAGELSLIAEDRFDFCWIVDFPMYEMNEESNHVDFSHNPFSMPQGELEALETKDPLEILAYQYDIVCNGYELCSGAVRNHRPDVMLKAFEIAGYSAATVEEEFGGMLNAFRYGAPPHGGLAPGIDRIVMLLAGQQAIREVIAFPLTQQGQDLMMHAPSSARETQLKDLHIRLGPGGEGVGGAEQDT